MRTSKRAASILGATLALVTTARALVSFLEAVSVVRDERERDLKLVELCQSGAARESPKMRAACLQAQADRASPLLLKAALRALQSAFEDFAAAISSPGRLMVLVVFAVLSIYAPLSGLLKAVVPADDFDGAQRVVVVAGDSQLVSPRQRLRRAVGALRLRKQRKLTSPLIEEIDEEDGNMISVDLSHGKAD